MAKRRRYSGRGTDVTFSMYDSEDREVEVTCHVTFGSKDYFSKSFGNWLPGDAPECEVTEIKAIDEGADVAEVEKDVDGIEEAAFERANDHDDCDYDDDGDR